MNLCFGLIFFSSLHTLTLSDGKEYTVEVSGGQRECYWETLKKPKDNRQVAVEYQVLDGGDLLIDASLHTPTGNLIFSDFRKSENQHRFSPTEDGEYQLCFDNGVSAYYERIVFFSFDTEDPGDEHDDDDDEDDDDYFKRIASPEFQDVQEYDGKVNDFKFRVERIHNRIETIAHFQTTIRSVESRDRHLAERNYEKVNFWSMVNLAVMVIVLVLQVFFIRSLFDEKSLLNQSLNKLSLFNSSD